MRIAWAIPAIFLVLGACGDPLAGVERVSDGVALPDSVVATALPSEEELAREESVLSGLFRTAADAGDTPVGGTPQSASNTDATARAAEQSAQAMPTDAVEAASITASVAPIAKPKGAFGWLRRAPATQAKSVSAEEVSDGADESENLDLDEAPPPNVVAQSQEVQIASLTPENTATPATTLAEPKTRRGLFGRAAPAATVGVALPDVTPGAALPFGEVARVCGMRVRDLGKVVEQAARKGSGYKLYDSAPSSAGPRSFYLTGFDDNCPRQFTAALAIFGSPEFHEQLRYGLPAKEYPYSTTDRAYEKVKSKVCNVGRNKPCGPRISRLENTTAFVSVYEHFGENARWADMLLHDGALLATSVKTP